MRQQNDIQLVCKYLGIWLGQIRTNNALDFYDINHVAEDVAAKLLNLVYNLELKNLNEKQKNFPGIDLGDDKNKVAFQITSRKDTSKIEESLKIFYEKHTNQFPGGIRFFILNNEKPHLNQKKCETICPGFEPDIDILTDKDLIVEIKKLYRDNRGRFDEILAFLEKEFKDEQKPGGRKTGDIFAILKKGSRLYYSALMGPTGRFKSSQKISNILLPRLIDKMNLIYETIDNLPDDEKTKIMPNLLEALPLLWKKECKHTVIVGKTGIGKTFSLIYLWRNFLEYRDEIKPVTVFISLSEYNEVKKEKRNEFVLSMIQSNYGNVYTTQKEIWEAMKQPSRQCCSNPVMVLLLDGLNEITVEKKELFKELDHITEQCPGVQLVISSRLDMRDNLKRSEWNLLELMELENDQVEKFLKTNGVDLPSSERFRAVCKNPMMLTLYTQTFKHSEIQESIGSRSKAKALRDIAGVYWEEKKFKKAYLYTREALDLDFQENPEILYKLGIYAALAKDTSNALTYIQGSIDCDPKYSDWVKDEYNWEEIKTDILNHLGCFANDETSKENDTTDEIELLFSGKDKVENIQDEHFLSTVRDNIRIVNNRMKTPSSYISYNCIRNWLKLKDIRPSLKKLRSLYKVGGLECKKKTEINMSSQNLNFITNAIWTLFSIFFIPLYVGTSIFFAQHLNIWKGGIEDKIINTFVSCIFIPITFLVELIAGLLMALIGQKNDLLSKRFIMAYSTIFILAIFGVIFTLLKNKKQKIMEIENNLTNINLEMERLKSDIMKQLSDIKWE